MFCSATQLSVPTFAGSLTRFKIDNGVPQRMASCHTALVDGYVIEGHVPATDIRRLLSERPDAIGLAVPEMPLGSPGMDQSEMREAYDVFLIRRDGSRPDRPAPRLLSPPSDHGCKSNASRSPPSLVSARSSPIFIVTGTVYRPSFTMAVSRSIATVSGI